VAADAVKRGNDGWPARTGARQRRAACRRALRPADLGLVASSAAANCRSGVAAVAFFSTARAALGRRDLEKVRLDSNRYTLWGMLQRLGVEVLDLGICAITRALEAALAMRSRTPTCDHLGGVRSARRPHACGDGRGSARCCSAHRDGAGAADGGGRIASNGPRRCCSAARYPVAVMVGLHLRARSLLAVGQVQPCRC